MNKSGWRRVLWNWQVYGIPRCPGYDFSRNVLCGGLIWPWQQVSGNGEEPMHRACLIRERETRDESERIEIAAWAQ